MKLHASGEDYLEPCWYSKRKKAWCALWMWPGTWGYLTKRVSRGIYLERGGFLTMDGDFFLRLTDVGREVAEQTYEKHCFFTRLLVEAGVDPKTAEQDACRMEHVISPESFLEVWPKLYQKAHPNTDPTGDGRQFHAKTDPAD